MSGKFAQMISKSYPSSNLQWPYCLRRCSYCNFNKYIPRENNNSIMTDCLQRETETLLQLSQVSRYGGWFDLSCSTNCTFYMSSSYVFNLQHHLSIFWWWDSKPGTPIHDRSDPWNCFQTGESVRWGWGHARGQPYSCGKVKIRGFLPCWG